MQCIRRFQIVVYPRAYATLGSGRNGNNYVYLFRENILELVHPGIGKQQSKSLLGTRNFRQLPDALLWKSREKTPDGSSAVLLLIIILKSSYTSILFSGRLWLRVSRPRPRNYLAAFDAA